MVVQVHALAAKALSDEYNSLSSLLDTKRASDIKWGLESCVQGLRGLQETLTPIKACLARVTKDL